MNTAPNNSSREGSSLVWRHLVVGWSGLLVFLTLGMALEALHGLKLDFYLDLRHQSRRLMWTLAHSHGTLFALVNIAFAWTIFCVGAAVVPRWVSGLLIAALVLMPLGFFLGGLWLYGGDPGLGIILAPVGGLALLVAVGGVTWSLRSKWSVDGPEDTEVIHDKSRRTGPRDAKGESRRSQRGRH